MSSPSKRVAPTPTFPDLAGKVALVTGGSRGIGAATCRALGANGVLVGVSGLDEDDDIARVAAEVRALGGEAVELMGDVTDPKFIRVMRERLEETLGPADIIIPFAGGVRSIRPLHEIAETEWHAVVDSNLTATYLTLKEFLPGMIEREAGAVVTMGSNVARQLDGLMNSAAYVSAKAGVVMMSRLIARELAPHGIRVNCVCPATTHSERVDGILTEEQIKMVADLAPLKRMGWPEDTAFATLYLCSDAASFITGATLDVSGGRTMM